MCLSKVAFLLSWPLCEAFHLRLSPLTITWSPISPHPVLQIPLSCRGVAGRVSSTHPFLLHSYKYSVMPAPLSYISLHSLPPCYPRFLSFLIYSPMSCSFHPFLALEVISATLFLSFASISFFIPYLTLTFYFHCLLEKLITLISTLKTQVNVTWGKKKKRKVAI